MPGAEHARPPAADRHDSPDQPVTPSAQGSVMPQRFGMCFRDWLMRRRTVLPVLALLLPSVCGQTPNSAAAPGGGQPHLPSRARRDGRRGHSRSHSHTCPTERRGSRLAVSSARADQKTWRPRDGVPVLRGWASVFHRSRLPHHAAAAAAPAEQPDKWLRRWRRPHLPLPEHGHTAADGAGLPRRSQCRGEGLVRVPRPSERRAVRRRRYERTLVRRRHLLCRSLHEHLSDACQELRYLRRPVTARGHDTRHDIR